MRIGHDISEVYGKTCFRWVCAINKLKPCKECNCKTVASILRGFNRQYVANRKALADSIGSINKAIAAHKKAERCSTSANTAIAKRSVGKPSCRASQ